MSCTLLPILHSLQEQLQAAQQARRTADSLAAAADSPGNEGGGQPPRTSVTQHPAAATPPSGLQQLTASGLSQPKAALTTEPAPGAEHSLGAPPPSAASSATEPSSNATTFPQPEQSAVAEPEELAPQTAALPCQPGHPEAHASRPEATATGKPAEGCGHLPSVKVLGNEARPAGGPWLLDGDQADESAPNTAADESASIVAADESAPNAADESAPIAAADESPPNAAADWSAEALQWKRRCRDLETQVMQLEYKLAMAELRQMVRSLLQCEPDPMQVLLRALWGAQNIGVEIVICKESFIKPCPLAQCESILISRLMQVVQQTSVNPMLLVEGSMPFKCMNWGICFSFLVLILQDRCTHQVKRSFMSRLCSFGTGSRCPHHGRP